MHRIALAALAFTLSACASNPKSWVPTPYTPPPGVTQTVWEECWRREEANARRLAGSRYDALSPKQKRCLIMRLAAKCALDAIKMLEVHAPEVAARCQPDALEDFIVDAELEQCGDDEGGGNEVLDLYRYLLGGSRRGGSVLHREAGNVCPAN